MNKAVDLFTTYQFIKRLVLPFNKWKAYELGIIDEQGTLLKPSSELSTQQERDAWGYFDILAANLKKLLGKLPGGKSAIASYAAAFLLLKEGAEEMSDEELLVQLLDSLDLVEDGVVTNVAASGAVAGTTGEPIVRKRRKTDVGMLLKRVQNRTKL